MHFRRRKLAHAVHLPRAMPAPRTAAAERPGEVADAAHPSAQHQAAADLPTAPRGMLKCRMDLQRLKTSNACDEERLRKLELALQEQALRTELMRNEFMRHKPRGEVKAEVRTEPKCESQRYSKSPDIDELRRRRTLVEQESERREQSCSQSRSRSPTYQRCQRGRSPSMSSHPQILRHRLALVEQASKRREQSRSQSRSRSPSYRYRRYRRGRSPSMSPHPQVFELDGDDPHADPTIIKNDMPHDLPKSVAGAKAWLLHGLVIEFPDKSRTGQLLDDAEKQRDINDDDMLKARYADWQNFNPGEYIVAVTGVSSTYTKPFLAFGITLHTNFGRALSFNGSNTRYRGQPFGFTAPRDMQIIDVKFDKGIANAIECYILTPEQMHEADKSRRVRGGTTCMHPQCNRQRRGVAPGVRIRSEAFCCNECEHAFLHHPTLNEPTHSIECKCELR